MKINKAIGIRKVIKTLVGLGKNTVKSGMGQYSFCNTINGKENF